MEVAQTDRFRKGERESKRGDLQRKWKPEGSKGAVEIVLVGRFLLLFARQLHHEEVTKTECRFFSVHFLGTHATEEDGARLRMPEVVQVSRQSRWSPAVW